MKKTVIDLGICAHADAGKTTLSEALLFRSGAIRKSGRVDHKDAFLDTYELEKERGITIFSKLARFETDTKAVTILDTPGHADFSAEMERVLMVLDYCLLIISAPDLVTGQVRTLWRLLTHYRIPTIIFVNKMDLSDREPEEVTGILKKMLSEGCIPFDAALPVNFRTTEVQESLAVLDDSLMESYLEEGRNVSPPDLRALIKKRRLFPLYFGSALKMEGVESLLKGLDELTEAPVYPEEFGARIFKITRENNKRLSWLKITGGSLKIRDSINGEKTDEIRLYSGARSEAVQSADAGTVCAVAGLSGSRAGMGLGFEKDAEEGLLQPLERCRVILPEGTDRVKALEQLKSLEEEEPMLHISHDDNTGEISAEIMGNVQTEIINDLLKERFGYEVGFGSPETVYKETILNAVEGVGHYEPLRHYAEVHLYLEPGERGSGLVFKNKCPRDYLTENYQKLIMTHLKERKFKGTLTGSEITDMTISLVAGRAHEKHTEGGDFRQATYRAVRQGLMMSEMVLLEPVLNFTLEVPSSAVGRAMTDLSAMSAKTEPPELTNDGTFSLLKGTIPASEVKDYARTVISYTSGNGRFFTSFKEYAPCHNHEEVIAAKAYDPELDKYNTGSSVFCQHGAGTIIPWNEVRKYMQIDTGWKPEGERPEKVTRVAQRNPGKAESDSRSFKEKEKDRRALDAELMAIFERTYGPIQRRLSYSMDDSFEEPSENRGPKGGDPKYQEKKKAQEPQKDYLLVDGYNIIHAWEELKALSQGNLQSARDRLMDILSNYAGYTGENVILVFDAYKVNGGRERTFKYNNISVVYTKEAETADLYIEKAAHELGKKHRVTVATSDGIEQVIIFGAGAIRLSALNLEERIRDMEKEISGKLGKI
ncbi:MAG: NYN domain-containing protein [Lachnospiraceae bacterium]|nr:NYN domain-containing protein [Lachnospiraceae bacterium]